MRSIRFVAWWLGAMGFFAGTAGAVPTVVLEPIPWASAGIGMHPLWMEADIELDVYVCDESYTCEEFELNLAATDTIAFHQHGVDFEADLVSQIDGNRWEYGIQSISASIGPDIESFSLGAAVFATFVVPFDGIHATTEVAYDQEDGYTEADSVLGIDSIQSHIATDIIKVRKFIGWGVSAYGDEPPSTGNNCAFGTQLGILLDDCINSVEIFSPTVVDGLRHPGPVAEPGSALVVTAGAALALGARRRRR